MLKKAIIVAILMAILEIMSHTEPISNASGLFY